MNHTFSIIVSVYNAAETLKRCIDSVVNQTYQKRELIIIDGESQDGTVEILQASNNFIDYWESSKDSGIYNAWNKALDHTSGDWIYFLGADDYLFSIDVLERAANELTEVPPECKLAYGQVCMLNKDGQVLFVKGGPWKKTDDNMPYPLGIPHQGVFHCRDLFKEYGFFDESFQIAGDHDFLLRVLKNSEPYFISNLIIAATGYYGKSSMPMNRLLLLKEFAIARRNNGYKSITLTWALQYIWALLMAFLIKIIGRKGVRNIIKICCKLTNQPPYWKKY